MPWDPEIYNQFKQIRYQPFFDLAALIKVDRVMTAVDIGCGTGEQTKLLSEKLAKAHVLGIDPSPEMLVKSKPFSNSILHFKQATVEEFLDSSSAHTWDLVFSNAALQWSDHHETLFPRLIALLKDNGQLAIQMPVQHENALNRLLLDLVQEKPFTDFLKGWKRESPLLTIDGYAQIMFAGGLRNIEIIQKVYPIIAESPDGLLDFISGSALIPYVERLNEEQRASLLDEFRLRIQRHFPGFPAIYAFKRLLLYGEKIPV
jgi:trans-aconitate 2-methyltransferase